MSDKPIWSSSKKPSKSGLKYGRLHAKSAENKPWVQINSAGIPTGQWDTLPTTHYVDAGVMYRGFLEPSTVENDTPFWTVVTPQIRATKTTASTPKNYSFGTTSEETLEVDWAKIPPQDQVLKPELNGLYDQEEMASDADSAMKDANFAMQNVENFLAKHK